MSRRQRRTREKHARHAPRRAAATGGLALAVTLLSGSLAEAATTLYVESSDDTQTHATCDVGDGCTLRDALTDAGDGDTIVFNSSLSGDEITPGSDLPTFSAGDLTIDGSNAPNLAVDGGGLRSLFRFDTSGTIAISDLHLKYAAAADEGSAVRMTGGGDLHLSAMDITSSTGPAVYATGPLTIIDSTFSGNYASTATPSIFYGGAVYSKDQLTISGSSFSSNSGASSGGAIDAAGSGAVTIDNTTLYDNTTTGSGSSFGGAIRINGAAGRTIAITGSTISHNYAYCSGCTALGGGVDIGNLQTAQIRDTVVSGNGVSGTHAYGPDLYGAFTVSFSLVGDGSGATITPDHDLSYGTDPQFDAFGAHGTPTLNPQPSSPLVDAGSSFGLTTDQRGMTRPFDASVPNAAGGDTADIGAVELQPADGVSAPPPPSPAGGTALPVVTALSPSGGPAGTSVAISGENFAQATKVLFGSAPAAFTIDADNHITAVAPPGAPGAVDVTVVNARGTSSTSAADRFTYSAAAPPAPGPPPIPGPTATTVLDRIRFGSDRDRSLHGLSLHGIVVHVTCDPGPCRVKTAVRQNGHVVGHATKTLGKGENIAVRTRLTADGLAWLRMHPVGESTGHLRLTVALVDGPASLVRVGRYRFTR